MSFIQREIDRIRSELLRGDERHSELCAAQQALEWTLEPSGIRSPHSMIMRIPGDSTDCSDALHPAESLGTCARTG